MASGIDPVVIRTESVLDGPYGAAVQDSLAAAALATSSRKIPDHRDRTQTEFEGEETEYEHH
jgi:hypothetical protein